MNNVPHQTHSKGQRKTREPGQSVQFYCVDPNCKWVWDETKQEWLSPRGTRGGGRQIKHLK